MELGQDNQSSIVRNRAKSNGLLFPRTGAGSAGTNSSDKRHVIRRHDREVEIVVCHQPTRPSCAFHDRQIAMPTRDQRIVGWTAFSRDPHIPREASAGALLVQRIQPPAYTMLAVQSASRTCGSADGVRRSREDSDTPSRRIPFRGGKIGASSRPTTSSRSAIAGRDDRTLLLRVIWLKLVYLTLSVTVFAPMSLASQ